MPRGRSLTYDDQRGAILARAAELFAARGYAATSMNEVATACGLTKPALYHYVRDKEALLLQICQAHIATLQALVDEVRSLGLPPHGHLRALILAFVRAYADAQAQHRVLTEDVRFLGETQREQVLDGQRRVVAAFASAVAAVRPGAERAGLHKALTMLLFGMINWMFTWLQPDGTLSHEDMAPMVADLFLGGLAALSLPESPITAPSPVPAPAAIAVPTDPSPASASASASASFPSPGRRARSSSPRSSRSTTKETTR